MKKLLPYLFFLTALSAPAQEIKSGTIFIIQFDHLDKNLDFKVVSEKPFKKEIDYSQIDSIFKTDPNTNQIIGVFAEGKFGSDNSQILVMYSGLENYTAYNLEIKLAGEGYIKTTTSGLLKNVKSIESWPYPIKKIRFGEFITRQPPKAESQFRFKKKVDSTCILNSNKNIEHAESEFKVHLNSVVEKFSSSQTFLLEEMLAYEKSIHSEDKSLGHNWSLSEGIYPNQKKFVFGNPISYRRIECPYFDDRITYFYTEIKHVKVVTYQWAAFNGPHVGFSDETHDTVDEKFDKKLTQVISIVTGFLGKPIEDITEEDEEGSRKLIRWKNSDGIHAYLYNFSNYNEINLSIYKE